MPENDLAAAARHLVATHRRGVLSTCMPPDGQPYASLAEYAPLPNGDALFFFSALAEHRRFLADDPRAALLIGPDLQADDALAQPRLTLVGRIAPCPDRAAQVPLYLQHHPQAEAYIAFADFDFFRLRVERARYIAGFGAMDWITADRYRPT